jgi:hypothetical protein
MKMRSRPSEHIRRLRGWLVPTALLALAPKCVLCGLAYTGLGAALGVRGPELCGATGTDRLWPMALLLLLVIVVPALVLARRYRALKRDPVHSAGNTSSSSTSKISPDSGGTMPACMLP